MKEIKQTIIDYELETIIAAGYNLVEYTKAHPEKLDIVINQLTNNEKDELLVYFSTHDNAKHMKHLIKHGANIDVLYNWVLYKSEVKGCLGIIDYLIEHGKDIHAYDDIVKYLIEQNIDTHIQDDEVRSPTNYEHSENTYVYDDVVKHLVKQREYIYAKYNS